MALLSISSHGCLQITATVNSEYFKNDLIYSQEIIEAFNLSQEAGLLKIAATKAIVALPNSLAYWRDYIILYITELCHLRASSGILLEPIAPPSLAVLQDLLEKIPPMPGAEYCTIDLLENIWHKFDIWLRKKVEKLDNNVAQFFTTHLPLWNQVGRVCFHLAENKQNPDYPFAFLATYSNKLMKNLKLQYQPLSVAIEEYAGADNKKALASLLQPVYQASKQCKWVQDLLDHNDIYHTLAWEAKEAYNLLSSVPQLEEAGIVVHLPDWWKKRPKPRVQVSIGNAQNNLFNANTLLDFNIDIAVEGKPLSQQEIEEIFAAENGLVLLRGQWVELDREKLQSALKHWQIVKRDVAAGGVTFIEGMRLLSGAGHKLENVGANEEEHTWSYVEAGDGLKKILQGLRNPETLQNSNPGNELHAKLRVYQAIGVNWLYFLTELGLGACLADDMGLGKTIQIIALLLVKKQQYKKQPQQKKTCSILVLPASLLANWKGELERFAPSLKILFIHASETTLSAVDKIAQNADDIISGFDLVLTTYGMLSRQPWLLKQGWSLVILDEAQAIKNPSSTQTKLAKELQGTARIALTGTPVENRLGDLWSLFDFICPGLLGSSARFKSFVKVLQQQDQVSFAPLRKLVQPYILRRLKTDKRIITDLPDKTEMTAWCGITKEQAKLYAQTVREMTIAIKQPNSQMQRRGLVLAYLTRFKQICNHPSQFLGDGEYSADKSGKFSRLKEICDEIAARQEKVLVFTQYREMTIPLSVLLGEIFGQPGLILHGGTPVKQRKDLVAKFLQEQGNPFFVLSLKAAGIGLNLTAASHVVHFDRWWNPAVENQATDRAYRIGQNKNVLVHKFVCRGTIEEKIDALISGKADLANSILNGNNEAKLTELSDAELISLVSLDIDKAQID